MPDRIVRAGILTSDSVNTLNWAAECFYRRLMSVADDYGRYDGRPSILRASLYPLKLDRVSERDIETWLRQCAEAGLVTVYTVESRQYVEILKFDQRLRALTSKWPAPPSSADIRARLTTNAAEAYSETDTETEKQRARARDPLPEAVMPPSLNMAAWRQWLDYRKQIRKPLKPASIPAAQKALAAFGCDQSAVVEQSVAQGWTGLFALKTNGKRGNGKQTVEDYRENLKSKINHEQPDAIDSTATRVVD